MIGLGSYSQGAHTMLGADRGLATLQSSTVPAGIGSGQSSAFTSINRRVSPSGGAGPATGFIGQAGNAMYQGPPGAGTSPESQYSGGLSAGGAASSGHSPAGLAGGLPQGPPHGSFGGINTTQYELQNSNAPQVTSTGLFPTSTISGQNSFASSHIDMRPQGLIEGYNRNATQSLSSIHHPGQPAFGLQYPAPAAGPTPGYPYPPSMLTTTQHHYPPGPANLLNIMRPSAQMTVQQEMTCEWVDPATKNICGRKYHSMHEIVTHITVDHVGGAENDDHTCYWKGCDRDLEMFKAKYKLINHIRYVPQT